MTPAPDSTAHGGFDGYPEQPASEDEHASVTGAPDAADALDSSDAADAPRATDAAAQSDPSDDVEATPTAGADEHSALADGAPNPLDVTPVAPPASAGPTRKRPRPGERRVQILQTLATMLEVPGAERVTTAALAARLEVSEAALYRHFASKAQMFEGLIEFIEQSVFTLVNQVVERESDPSQQVRRIVGVLLQFGEKNPGMTRVMTGDALVFENERLMTRMNQFFDRIESQLRQPLRVLAERHGSTTPSVEASAQASALTAFTIGRLHRFARSGFRRGPAEQLDLALRAFAA